jgi:hypothetical protein
VRVRAALPHCMRGRWIRRWYRRRKDMKEELYIGSDKWSVRNRTTVKICQLRIYLLQSLVAEPALTCVFTGIADSITSIPPDDNLLCSLHSLHSITSFQWHSYAYSVRTYIYIYIYIGLVIYWSLIWWLLPKRDQLQLSLVCDTLRFYSYWCFEGILFWSDLDSDKLLIIIIYIYISSSSLALFAIV